MSATYTLETTTLSFGIGTAEGRIAVSSRASITAGQKLYIDKELFDVLDLDCPSPWVNVKRGDEGTGATSHSSSALVWIGNPDQFYSQNPAGSPLSAVLVYPWINILTGQIWYPQGDEVPYGQTFRYWQERTVTFGVGPLGIATSEASSGIHDDEDDENY